MTTHEPECRHHNDPNDCWAAGHSPSTAPDGIEHCNAACICVPLRACRERTLNEAIAVIAVHRDDFHALVRESDDDSLVGRRYRDYTAAHEADLAAIDKLRV